MKQIKIDFFRELLGYLEADYGLYDAIAMLSSYHEYSFASTLLKHLNQGQPFEHLITQLPVDEDFKEMVGIVSKLNNLSESIKVALRFSEIKTQLKQMLKKNLSYPLLLVVLISIFSLIMQHFLYPQMVMMMQSFEIDHDQTLMICMFLVRLIPNILNCCILFLGCFSVWVIYLLKSHNQSLMYQALHLGLSKIIIQSYFSLKFAIYFSVINNYIPGLHQCIDILYERLKHTDLLIVVYDIKERLEKGESFIETVKQTKFFHPSLIRFIQLILEKHQSLTQLDHFVTLFEARIERKIKHLCQCFIGGIYIITSFYIVLLYITILIPLLNMSGNL